MKFDAYDPQNGPFYDETFAARGVARPGFEPLVNGINALDSGSLLSRQAAAERALLAAVAPGGVLLLVHHAGMDTQEPHDGGFDPADYVWPTMVAALLDDDWVVELNEQRPRIAPEHGAGAHHAEDLVLRARRLR